MHVIGIISLTILFIAIALCCYLFFYKKHILAIIWKKNHYIKVRISTLLFRIRSYCRFLIRKYSFFFRQRPIKRLLTPFFYTQPFKLQIAPRRSWIRWIHHIDKQSPSPPIELPLQYKSRRYDLYLAPDAIKNWYLAIVTSFTLIQAIWVFLKCNNNDKTLPCTFNSSYIELATPFIIQIALLITLYYLTFFIFFRIPTLVQCWGKPMNTYETWFEHIPQEIIFSLCNKVRIKKHLQAMYIISEYSGSSQQSFYEFALRNYYHRILASTLFRAFSYYAIAIPFLFPVWASYLSLKLAILYNFSYVKLSSIIVKNPPYPLEYLYTSIYLWLGFSLLYLFWIRDVFTSHKEQAFNTYIKQARYIPPSIRNLEKEDPSIYKHLKEKHFHQSLGIIFSVFFIIYIMLLDTLSGLIK